MHDCQVEYLGNWKILHDGVHTLSHESLNVLHFTRKCYCHIFVICEIRSEQVKFLIVVGHKVLLVFTRKFQYDVMITELMLPFC